MCERVTFAKLSISDSFTNELLTLFLPVLFMLNSLSVWMHCIRHLYLFILARKMLLDCTAAISISICALTCWWCTLKYSTIVNSMVALCDTTPPIPPLPSSKYLLRIAFECSTFYRSFNNKFRTQNALNWNAMSFLREKEMEQWQNVFNAKTNKPDLLSENSCACMC